MANKNKHVIIGYFPSKEAATEAAAQLKAWDKANKDIKLGGIGILTADKGKIKTRKVGNRAGGTGAKWGLILGAATGILSGGVTLIGGAAAGLVGGTVMGALFHKSLGLTDADKERLELHLQDGGAALVVMADEHEVEPTKAELARLGGRVEDYLVPEETMEQVEESTKVEPVAEEEIQVSYGRERSRGNRSGHWPCACRRPGCHRDHHQAGAVGTRRNAGGPSRDRRAEQDQRETHRQLGERRRSLAGQGDRCADGRTAPGGRCDHGGRSGPAGGSQPPRATARRQRNAETGTPGVGCVTDRELDRSG